MKYKVGDKVRIKSKEWFDAQVKNESEDILCPDNWYFTIEMSEYCRKCATIVRKKYEGYYDIDIDDGVWCWTDEMFEDEEVEPNISNVTFETIDWEQRRYEIAKAALQGVLADSTINLENEKLVEYCISAADEMVKQLRLK